MEAVLRGRVKFQIFCNFAEQLKELSTCKRRKCACVIFDPSYSTVWSIGYNGLPSGIPHEFCDGTVGSCGCVHAEANALIKLPPVASDRGLLMLATTAPCSHCAGLIVNSRKISIVYYSEPYRDSKGLDILALGGIVYDQV